MKSKTAALVAAAAAWCSPLGVFAGDPWFDAPISTALPEEPLDVAVADIDGDGDLDAIVGSVTGDIFVLRNDGEGVLSLTQTIPSPGAGMFLAAGNLCGDSKPDLAAVDFSGYFIRIFCNDGTGLFGAAHQSISVDERTFRLAIGDLDEDGSNDLVLGAWGEVHVYWGNGNGVSETPQIRGVSLIPAGGCDESTIPVEVLLADVSESGRPDIVVASYYFGDCGGEEEHGIARLRNHGDRNIAPVEWIAREVYVGNDVVEDIAVGQVDAGDTPDIVAGFGTTVRAYLKTGPGMWTAGPDSEINAGDLVLADLDEDGFLDIGNGNGGGFFVAQGDGSGEFALVHVQTPRSRELVGASMDARNGIDLVAIDRTAETVDVFPNLVAPEVSGLPEWAPDAGVRVTPSVLGSGSTEIRVLSALDDTHRLRVLDVLGRIVRSLDVEHAVATWDLKDRRGARVPDGTYWVVGPTGGQVGRIVVVR